MQKRRGNPPFLLPVASRLLYTYRMKLLPALSLLLLTCPVAAETCSYGKVGESVMISNLALGYGKKGACFGSAEPTPTSTGKKSKTAAATATPADFPRVDAATQQQRDNSRRKILDTELSAERSALQQAKNSGNTADIALHEKNVQMLEKEISGIK
jgi:hypothetical protein